jgi:biotin synthase-related radical SAM superfamily protein
MWEENIDVQYVLNPCFAAVYCTFYLTKVNKSITQEMQSMLNKCKHEQYETSKRIKRLKNALKNAQQMSIQQIVHIS